MSPASKSLLFSNRVCSWYVLDKLVKMRDNKSVRGYNRRVVEMAVQIECDDKVMFSWEKVEA